MLRLAAVKPEGTHDIGNLLMWSFEQAIIGERERIATAVERLDNTMMKQKKLAKHIRGLKE
jgi:hypothetical protein